MVIGHGDPALGGGLQAVLRDALLAVVDGDGAVQRDPLPLAGSQQGRASRGLQATWRLIRHVRYFTLQRPKAI